MTPQQLWTLFSQDKPHLAQLTPEAWAFGGDPDGLAQLVLQGRKTATSSAFPLYAQMGEALPQPGSYSVILNSQGQAVCIVRTTQVTLTPFCRVDARHAWLEGEGDRSLAHWQQIHRDYFAREMSAAHLPFSGDMTVVCEEFQLVHPCPGPADPAQPGEGQPNPFSRTQLLLGAGGMERLRRSHVAVFGIGGVGSYVAEALARSGVGRLSLFDSDTVSLTNLNRQLIALHSTVGQPKVEVMARRILDINPNAQVIPHQVFYTAENAGSYDLSAYDYIVDAIDTVSSKLLLIQRALEAKTPILCSMGTGNKLDPTRLELCDLAQTTVCPLARVMRRELRRRGITHLPVLYSTEEPRTPIPPAGEPGEPLPQGKRQIPASCAFVPSAAGLILAGKVVRDLAGVPLDEQAKMA